MNARRVLWCLGMLAGSLLALAVAWAADEPAPATDQRKEAQAQAASQLNGSSWSLELTPMSGDKPKKPLKDTVQFDQGKVTSSSLSSKGYPSTNYTLTVGDDGIPVWETMQTSASEGVVFWRGELHGETMTGVLSKHPAEGAAEDYSFAGQRVGGSSASSASAAASVEVASSSPDSSGASAQPTPEAPKKKKKKGWFGR